MQITILYYVVPLFHHYSTLTLTALRSNSYDNVCLHHRGRARGVSGKPLMERLFFPVGICDLRRIENSHVIAVAALLALAALLAMLACAATAALLAPIASPPVFAEATAAAIFADAASPLSLIHI